MTCAICQTSYAPHELCDGKCLSCLHQEALLLREIINLLMQRQGHLQLTIEPETSVTPEFVKGWWQDHADQEAMDNCK